MPASIDVDRPRPRSRRWLRWVVVAAVVVVVAAAALLLRGLTAEEPSLPDQLASEVVTVLEAASPAEHADHGHHFADEGRVLCAAEVFGFDPPGASTVAEVEVVYAQHMCAIVVEGQGWPAAVRASGPLAVELTDPPVVILPDEVAAGEGALHADRVRALIPERYHGPALAPGFADPAVADGLRERIEDAQ